MCVKTLAVTFVPSRDVCLLVGLRLCDRLDFAKLLSGLASHHFIADLADDETERLHTQNIERALAAGAFGVPTFVTDAGEVFFGQDRLPVLRDHLWGVAD